LHVLYRFAIILRMNQPLTPIQKTIYVFVKNYLSDKGNSPTLEEIRAFIGVKAINTIVDHLKAIERKGYIARRKHAKRNIELRNSTTHTAENLMLSIPVIASVGCDDLSVFANEQYDEFLEVDKKIIAGRMGVVAVRAMGGSMNDAGIEDGDYILVEPTSDVENGERVVAIVDGMVTVKRLNKTGNLTILNPESNDPKYKPIILNHDFKVAGKVICSIPRSSMEPELTFEKIIN